MAAGWGAGDGEMGHVDLLCGEIGRPAGFSRRQCAAKKGELKAVCAAVFAGQIAGIVPPLGGVVVVGAVVEWKLELQRLQGAGETVVHGPTEDIRDVG